MNIITVKLDQISYPLPAPIHTFAYALLTVGDANERILFFAKKRSNEPSAALAMEALKREHPLPGNLKWTFSAPCPWIITRRGISDTDKRLYSLRLAKNGKRWSIADPDAGNFALSNTLFSGNTDLAPSKLKIEDLFKTDRRKTA